MDATNIDLIPYGYSSELEEKGLPWVESIKVTYGQAPDCEQSTDEVQTITLESVSNGIAPFIRISFPEDSPKCWAIDGDGSDLIDLINDFNKRLNYHEERNKN